MARAVRRTMVDRAGLAELLRPRDDVVLERAVGEGRFEAVDGPVRGYRRAVEVEPAGEDRFAATQTVDFQVALPYFGWLVVLPLRRALTRAPSERRWPWWSPPARLDARAAAALATLAALSVLFGYLNTLFTQTIAFAGEEFGAGNSAQGVAGSVVRVGGLISLVVVATADRRGRRPVLLTASLAGCVLAAGGALAPSLAWLTASQVLARAFVTALLIVVAVVAAEEMPAGARAWAVSVLALAGGLGAGVCVTALRLADLGPGGWRLLYLLPLAGLALVADVRHRLPESRRFTRPHGEAGIRGHEARFWLLAITGFLLNLFVAPNSQFSNRFLRHEQGFSGGGIAALTLVTGTPAGVAVVCGGRLADAHGRRLVAAVAVTLGTLCTVAFYFSSGWALWAWSIAGTVIADAAIPALGVYGPELFPTAARGRANGLIAVTSLSGSALGLVAAGVLSDRWGAIGPAMAVLAAGPLAVALLVLLRYPETAGRELEDLNPEDRAAPP